MTVLVMSKDQKIIYLFPHYSFIPMQDIHPKPNRKFFKNILLPKRTITKSILSLPLKQIVPDEKTEQIIHAKSFMQQKLNPNAKFKLLFETLTKPVNRNPFAFSHLHRKDALQEKSLKRPNSDLSRMPKINQLIFKSEMQALSKRIQQNCSSPQKRPKQARLSFVYLRRSFKISQNCKSSLLSISHKDQQRQYALRYTSLSSSNTTIKQKKPELKQRIKREFSMRSSYRPYRPKPKITERFYTNKDQIRGWQTEIKNYVPISPEDLNAFY